MSSIVFKVLEHRALSRKIKPPLCYHDTTRNWLDVHATDERNTLRRKQFLGDVFGSGIPGKQE